MALTRHELAAAARASIAEVLGTEPDAIKDSTDLQSEYDIDSLELMAVGAQLERSLDIQIEVDDLLRAETVGQAIDMLAARLAATA
ncbi:acyl carrier protein [Streptomyces sp. NPDC020096]